jgi:hypothetical protein
VGQALPRHLLAYLLLGEHCPSATIIINALWSLRQLDVKNQINIVLGRRGVQDGAVELGEEPEPEVRI